MTIGAYDVDYKKYSSYDENYGETEFAGKAGTRLAVVDLTLSWFHCNVPSNPSVFPSVCLCTLLHSINLRRLQARMVSDVLFG